MLVLAHTYFLNSDLFFSGRKEPSNYFHPLFVGFIHEGFLAVS